MRIKYGITNVTTADFIGRHKSTMMISERINMNRTSRILFGFVAVAVVVIAAVYGVAYAGSTNNVTCTVNSKESVVKSTENGTGHEYRLYTEGVDGCDVFTVGDELWSLNFESASTYNQITEGETYHLTTRGWRVPLFSMFPNVVRVL